MREYRLNPEAAKAAGAGTRITETGKYVGQIAVAASVVSSLKGSEGVEVSFEAEDGRTADYMTIWTHSREGTELPGFRMLNALMTCMKVRELKASKGTVPDGRDGATKEAFVYPALCQRVGLLLQRENYVNGQGREGFKFDIVLPFDPVTGQSAAEVLNREMDAVQVDRIASTLKDKAPRNKPAGSSPHTSSGHPANGGGNAGLPDDDIPFNVYMPRRAAYAV
jgi:hypothetical protein